MNGMDRQFPLSPDAEPGNGLLHYHSMPTASLHHRSFSQVLDSWSYIQLQTILVTVINYLRAVYATPVVVAIETGHLRLDVALIKHRLLLPIS